MNQSNQRVEKIRARLAEKPMRRVRPGSISELVSEVASDIQAARAAGKTWLEIAAALSDDAELNPATVRIAFARLNQASDDWADPSATETLLQAHDSAKSNLPAKDIQNKDTDFDGDDLFGPMFDVAASQRKIAGTAATNRGRL